MSDLVLVFDTETTGLLLHPSAPLAKQPKIIEFGGVLLDRSTFAVVEEVNFFIDPGEPITEEITRITGITDADVAGAGRFDKHLPEFRRIFGGASTVVAHNLPFDKGMMMNELVRCVDRGAPGSHTFPWPKNEVCTVGMFREEWGRNPRLIELYEATMGRPLAQTHRALDDVKALVEILSTNDYWRSL